MSGNLYQPMVEYLEAMIASGKSAPGAKIPTLRALCAQFDISTGTAVRGIRHLAEKGLLEVRHGAGTFVCDRENRRAHQPLEYRIALFIVSNDPARHYCAHSLRGVQDAASRKNCLLQTRFMPHEALTERHLQTAAQESDAILFLGDYDTCLRKLPRIRPCVGLEMHKSFGQLNSTITLDPVNAAETAAAFFERRGCRKVVIFTHPGPVHQMRSTMFAEQWKKSGEVVLQCLDAYDLAPHMQLELRDPDLGYLFVSGQSCNFAAEKYRNRTGRLLAADRHVLSIDGKSRIVPGFEPMNTIGIDWYQAGIVAFEECLRRIVDPGSPSRRIYIPGRFFAYDYQEKPGKARARTANTAGSHRSKRHE